MEKLSDRLGLDLKTNLLKKAELKVENLRPKIREVYKRNIEKLEKKVKIYESGRWTKIIYFDQGAKKNIIFFPIPHLAPISEYSQVVKWILDELPDYNLVYVDSHKFLLEDHQKPQEVLNQIQKELLVSLNANDVKPSSSVLFGICFAAPLVVEIFNHPFFDSAKKYFYAPMIKRVVEDYQFNPREAGMRQDFRVSTIMAHYFIKRGDTEKIFGTSYSEKLSKLKAGSYSWLFQKYESGINFKNLNVIVSENDKYVPPENSLLGATSITVLSGYDHLTPFESPKKFAKVLEPIRLTK